MSSATQTITITRNEEHSSTLACWVEEEEESVRRQGKVR